MSTPHAPRFAVSVATTYHSTFEQDVADYAAAGVEGIGLWEYKLPDDGRDEERVAQLREHGLATSFVFPNTPGIFTGNGHFAHPKDPAERLELLCRSVARFAAFEPAALCLLAGAPGPDGEGESWRQVVAAFQRVSAVAADSGVPLALEVISPGAAGSLVPTIDRTLDLISDVGAENIGVLLDVWHIAEEPVEHISRHIDRIAGIQVCDRTPGHDNRFDRALPGRGELPVREIVRTAHDAGYRGWWELEIFSDDGTFGAPVADSMWRWPASQVLDEGRAAFDAVYAAAVPSCG